MIVGEFCSREVIIVERESTIVEAAKVMRRHHSGDVVVVDGRGEENIPVGILTDRDIVVELLAEEVDLAGVGVGDVMSAELQVVREGDDLLETVQLMGQRGVRRMPVVSEAGNLVGIIALDDMLEIIAELLSDLVRLLNRESRIERERRA